MKKETTARIVSQTRLLPDICELTLETELAGDARPGQFVGLYCRDGARLLPRPISICGVAADGDLMRLVYRTAGAGTGEIATLQTDDRVRMIGNLGNGYDLSAAAGKRVLAVGGGLGIPPILFLVRSLRELDGEAAPVSVKAVLGYRNADTFLLEDFRSSGETLLASDDGSVGCKGTVLDAIRGESSEADMIFACGPLPMLRALARYSEERSAAGFDIGCYVSLEEHMACGVGACLGCVVRTTSTDAHSLVNNARICTEGPVFDSRAVAWEAEG